MNNNNACLSGWIITESGDRIPVLRVLEDLADARDKYSDVCALVSREVDGGIEIWLCRVWRDTEQWYCNPEDILLGPEEMQTNGEDTPTITQKLEMLGYRYDPSVPPPDAPIQVDQRFGRRPRR